MRPECENPVKHISFSIPEGEHLTDGQWLEVGSSMASTLGYDAWILVGHDDKDHEDVHFVGSRITKGGEIIRETMQGFAMTEGVCREMERKFGLRQVASPERLASGRKKNVDPLAKITRPEQKMMDRTGKKSWKVQLQLLVEAALETRPTTLPEFEAALVIRGVDVAKKVQLGEVTGLTYIHRETGEKMNGTHLGEMFKAGSIQTVIAKNYAEVPLHEETTRIPSRSTPSILDRRAERVRRAARAAASAARAGADAVNLSVRPQIIPGAQREPMGSVVVEMGEAMDGRERRSAPGSGPESGLGGELGLGDRGGPGAGRGLRGGDRGGPGQADNHSGAVGRDVGGGKTGRSGGMPEPADERGLRAGSEPERRPLPDSGFEPLSIRIPREIREHEASDPQDLRDLVVLQAELIHEVFPEAILDLLQPVQEAIELPGGHIHTLRPIQATGEAITGEVFAMEDKIRAGFSQAQGQGIALQERTVFMAEVMFRQGYGLPQLQVRADLPKQEAIATMIMEEPWGAIRLGRLVRQSWNRLLDRAMELVDQARRVLGFRAESAGREDLRKSMPPEPFWDGSVPTEVPEEAPEKLKGKKGLDFN